MMMSRHLVTRCFLLLLCPSIPSSYAQYEVDDYNAQGNWSNNWGGKHKGLQQQEDVYDRPQATQAQPYSPFPQAAKEHIGSKARNNSRRYSGKSQVISSGTGFYVNRRGYMVTNAHVVKNCSYIDVKGGVEVSEARIIASDSDKDLALLRTEARPTRIAPLRYHNNLKKGDKVMIIGYPGSNGWTRQHAIKVATVVDTKGLKGEDDWIQFSSSSQKGNSGGPLLDMNGNVIGVVTAKIMRYDPLGGSLSEHVDLAINMLLLKRFLDRHYVHYDQLFAFPERTEKHLEHDAQQYVVSIHCVQ